ncbi:ImmA/IrrE family metallo-endopeptidase [Pseudoxanthomonas winnipegensis]|uniref:ImmA/IrrE family metallo-endopeptidase n=2 Tax=Pseudoxanthomonas winnipegensis TaxID=2480810 RepID=A0ABY1WBY1_9GAMM|nr:ImmA/IrrE family metallo-endopeptidase [Pseudoxanthomonas winnipegensis]TAA18517.1 ImmA/IrrE family metallo-endopeptidase [Pseudoxanthomonas winnipegensis]TAH74107.1 ImmA/IrrE family metallo-endopeptidase [Pseudoxanthomonas winnipegensis]
MNRAISTFQPARLEQAMAARGYSAVLLADLVGVTSTTISRWRNEAQVPSGDVLFRLASALRVTPEWLTRPAADSVARPFYRGSIAQMKGERALLCARVQWLDELADQLGMYVEYPKVNVPTKSFKKPTEISHVDIESAAEDCRRAWGLKNGPVSDVVLLLENAGAIVAREETGAARIEGLSTWSSKGRPLVLLCADKGNAFRSRFDAAHELGHLVLHSEIEAPGDAATHKLIEDQAHRFAGAFLMPAKSFVAEVALPVTLQGLLMLKQRWGVSVGAMIMRLSKLGLLSENDYLRLIKLRSAKWGSKQEPQDDERKPEEPRLLRRTVELLHSSGVVRRESLSDFTGLSGRDVEALLNLPWGQLTQPSAEVVSLSSKGRQVPLSEQTDNVISFPAKKS